jgi:hypothetical protein
MAVSKFKDFGKSNICKKFIEAYKPIFDAYPELNAIPVYAWGRYYKYELAGDPFEVYPDERGLSRFKGLRIGSDIQWDIIKKIDDEHNIRGGKLWVGEWGDYSPNREDVVKAFNFDARAGHCLVIFKKDNEFEVKEFGCDSPE